MFLRVPELFKVTMMVTGAVSLFSIKMDLINLRVDAAGAATMVTWVVPFSWPSLDPSTNVVPLSSEYAVTNDGLVVAGAPVMATVIVLLVVSKTNILNPYLEMNQANAEPPVPVDPAPE